jgi:hypothetical protein
MEVIAIVILVTLTLIIWKIIEVNDNVEQVNARLNNIDVVLVEYYKMLKELQPPKPVEIPTRLSEDVLKEIYSDEDIKEFKEWDTTLMDGLEDK